MKRNLRPGHTLQLLEGGRQLFAAMVQRIDQAHAFVWVETYILQAANDTLLVLQALERAAQRGLDVRLMVDAIGTPSLEPEWLQRLQRAGVQYQIYRPLGRLGLLIPSRWRRLHRKLCVVDGVVGFCGGINLIDDLDDLVLGRLDQPRLDFALQVQGPLLRNMQDTMATLWRRTLLLQDVAHRDFALAWAHWQDQKPHAAPDYQPIHKRIRERIREQIRNLGQEREPQAVVSHEAQAALLLRDNILHRHDIERAYLKAIGSARQHIIIANAYLIPGRRLRRALALAVQRGVRVQLLIQGRYERFLQYHAARPVHAALLRAGIEIHEYVPSALHAKVAVVDGRWATVGSTNLDPLSLLLAREANVVTTDRPFAQQLQTRLQNLLTSHGLKLELTTLNARPWWQRAQDVVAFAIMRMVLFLTGHRY
jgi:cardiolipin synthase